MEFDVLVADDSDFMRSLIAEVLPEDFSVVGEAKNGVEAVELFRSERPDVVIMDIVMPITDGVEATREITDLDPEATVVMCTELEAEQKMMEAIEAGAEGYVTKPFERESLIDQLRTVT